MAGLEDASGGSHLELRLAAETAAIRLMLRMERWEEAARAAAALFNVCLKAGFQVGPKLCVLLHGAVQCFTKPTGQHGRQLNSEKFRSLHYPAPTGLILC